MIRLLKAILARLGLYHYVVPGFTTIKIDHTTYEATDDPSIITPMITNTGPNTRFIRIRSPEEFKKHMGGK